MKNKFISAVSILLALIMAQAPAAVFCENDISSSEEVSVNAADGGEQAEIVGLYEMNFLNSLGIVSFTEGMLTQSVTNEEFAGAAGLIGGIVSDYYQDGVLDMLVKCGHLPSACAYPDRTIKYMQAVKGMVSVLGYDEPAQNLGGYPGGYIIEASKLKITKGLADIGNEENLTYGVMCVMMYNALDVKRVVRSVYGPDTATYEKDEKVVNDVFEIYEAFGRVSANSVTSLDGTGGYNPGTIRIDGVEFQNSNSSYDDYFGYNVRYYYKHDGASVYRILYMELDEGANKILETDENDGTYIEDKNIYYYMQNEKLKCVSISDGYCLVYNKKVTDKGLESYAGIIDGYIKMADTDRDGKYDFIEINSYDTIYVSKINSYNSEIFDKYDASKSASFDEKLSDTRFIIRDTKGNDIAFSSVKKGSVVSVLMSEDKTVAHAIVSDEVISLTVDSISNPGNGQRAYIYSGDDRYPVSESLADFLDDITPGEQYKLALDFSGYIAGYEKAAEFFETGLIMGVKVDTNGLDKTAQIKVFSTDESIKIFDLADNVTVDGVTYKDNTKACDALYKTEGGQSVYKSKLIRYCVKNDKIINIDTAFYNKNDESENSLQMVGTESSKLLSRDAQCFAENYGSGFVYDASTTVFMTYVYDEPENETEYKIIKITDLSNANSYPNVAGYSTSAKTPDVEYVVIALTKAASTQLQSSNYMTVMFDSIAKRTDANGEEKYCVYGTDLLKNTKLERLVDDVSKLSSIEKGDILNIRFTYGGEIGSIYKAYDAKTDTVLFNDSCSIDGNYSGTGPSYGTTPRWLSGRAYSAGSSYIYLLPESRADLIEESGLSDCKMVAIKRRQPGIYVYDTKKSKDREFLTAVSRDSVNDYLNTGAGADRLLVSTYPAEYTAIIIFR